MDKELYRELFSNIYNSNTIRAILWWTGKIFYRSSAWKRRLHATTAEIADKAIQIAAHRKWKRM